MEESFGDANIDIAVKALLLAQTDQITVNPEDTNVLILLVYHFQSVAKKLK